MTTLAWVYVDTSSSSNERNHEEEEDNLKKIQPYMWRIINALQNDAKKKGILKGRSFGSFWHNIADITWYPTKCFIALHPKNTKQVVGYFVLDQAIGCEKKMSQEGGRITIKIFEVLPRWRGKGYGTRMLAWLIEKAQNIGYTSLRLWPANKSDAFWNKNQFIAWDETGFLTRPLQ